MGIKGIKKMLGVQVKDRQAEDFYATPPKHTRELLLRERFLGDVIWEPSCGEGAISEVLKAEGYRVHSTDLVDRGYGSVEDFLTASPPPGRFDIVTNPPYGRNVIRKYQEKCLEHLEAQPDGSKVALLMRLMTMATTWRKPMYERWRPKFYVFSNRIGMVKAGVEYDGGMVDYMWVVFEKGKVGRSTVEWI